MNSNIAMMLQGIRIPDPLEGYQKALTLQHLMGKNDLQRLQIERAGKRDTKELHEARARWAAGMLSVPKQYRAAVYASHGKADWEAQGLGAPGVPTPQQWDDSIEANVERLAAAAGSSGARSR